MITIPKALTGRDELVVLPRKVFEQLVFSHPTTIEVLRLSREAKKMKRLGTLPILRSLKELRS